MTDPKGIKDMASDVKTERALADVQRELDAAEGELSVLHDRVRSLRDERDRAAVAASTHPWLGKTVKRTKLVGYGSKKKPVTNRGTVEAYDPKVHRRLRLVGGSYGINAGDMIVIHSGGNTGWKLNEFDWGKNRLKCAWELDEQ